MSRTKERIQNFILFITDALCMVLAYYLSGYFWLQVYKGFAEVTMRDQLHDNVFTVAVAYVVMILLYTEAPNFTARGRFRELMAVIKKNMTFAGVIAVYELLRRKQEYFPRGVYVLTIVIATLLMWIIRMIVKSILLHRGQGRSALRMIAITTRARAEKFLEQRNEREDWMRKLSGLIIVDEDMVGQEIQGVPVVSNQDKMMDYILQEIADEVYLDLGPEKRDKLQTLVLALEDMGVTVHLKLDVLELFDNFDMTMSRMNGNMVATFAHRIYPYKKLVIKRVFDFIGGLVGTLIMFVFLIFVGPAIKLESKGPIFFKQKRVGKGGRYFYIYKFRSMYMDAEERKKELMAQNEMDGLMFKMKDDPRITKVGKFIRKTSIDELPQFINVLKGDMSLVGTRPPTVNEFKEYEGHHRRRLTMKPGITGMWQAYGRNTVQDFEDVVRMDCQYIDNWSLGLDLKILFRTVITVFTDGGQ